MEKHYDALMKTNLFSGIERSELGAVLKCSKAALRRYEKKEFIFFEQDEVDSLAILVSGSVLIFSEDYEGRRAILSELSAPALFAEAIACSGVAHSPVSARADENSEIIFIKAENIIRICAVACPFHQLLVTNLLRVVSRKNLYLTEKLDIVSRRTTRDKLLAYFAAQRKKAQSHEFTLPFSREELADYLGVNRSAMSRELGDMRDEGLIEISGRRILFL